MIVIVISTDGKAYRSRIAQNVTIEMCGQQFRISPVTRDGKFVAAIRATSGAIIIRPVVSNLIELEVEND